MAIKAINTHYDGHYFRSRLEARWAVFFNAIGVTWEYEPEGFNFDGFNYLPDFWLPKEGYYVEVKGGTKDVNVKMLQSLADNTCKPVMLVRNIPHHGCCAAYSPSTNIKIFLSHGGQGHLDSGWFHDYGHQNGYDTHISQCSCGPLYTPYEHCDISPDYRCPFCMSNAKSKNLYPAFDKARKARFEHGENG